ncbi:IS256 family transposase [Methanosalsum natronophilum]|uniref:IS256 family transposase n=1 Tax=Methanosalsum natronophilum TaxID=768733 RepID=UPI002169B6CA|nr:IS256 family transposase [Methanosalsum natronophilum]MCS3924966.1 transposase-like protein [Methanosalsum natronophilum]
MNVYDLITDYLNDEKDALIPLLTWFLNRVMEQEALEQSGAQKYQRTEYRKALRNGYRDRTLTSRHGELELRKPQFREFPFETKVFDKYSRTEKAIENAIVESYIQGVSTRKVEKIIAQLGVENISRSRVSRIAQELDEKVNEFLNKPIESQMRYLFVDATYFKIREGVRYLNKPMFIVAGVNEEGYREILGARIADSEDAMFWEDFFSDLKERGLKGVELVVSDGHKGIQKAIQTSFIGSSWQMCHVHFIRTVLKKVPKKYHKQVTEKLKEILEDAGKIPELVQEMDVPGVRKAADTIERFKDSLNNYQAFPEEHWKRIRTTNIMERINKELKRRSKVVGAFPNQEALMRLGVSILIDMNEEWLTGNRYLNMDL